MERPLKQRLVGAAVLVVLVVLVLPELLSGRREVVTLEPTRDEGGAPLLAHEFVLGDAPSAEEQAVAADELQPEPAPVEAAESPVLPPEPAAAVPVAAAPAPVVAAPVVAAPVAAAPVAAAPVAPVAAARVAPAPAAAPVAVPARTPPATKPPTTKPAATPAPNMLGAWVVQIGSFGTSQKAEQLVADLRGRGFRAFTLPYTANGRTLHRVRVGPEQNRKSADEIAKRLADLGYTPHVAPQE